MHSYGNIAKCSVLFISYVTKWLIFPYRSQLQCTYTVSHTHTMTHTHTTQCSAVELGTIMSEILNNIPNVLYMVVGSLFKDRSKFLLNSLVQERAKCIVAFPSHVVYQTGTCVHQTGTCCSQCGDISNTTTIFNATTMRYVLQDET